MKETFFNKVHFCTCQQSKKTPRCGCEGKGQSKMHKVKTNQHWAAYLAASERAAAPRRRKRPFEVRDTTGICRAWFWSFAGTTAAVIGWLLLFGWQ